MNTQNFLLFSLLKFMNSFSYVNNGKLRSFFGNHIIFQPLLAEPRVNDGDVVAV